jgi:hypothetical protein
MPLRPPQIPHALAREQIHSERLTTNRLSHSTARVKTEYNMTTEFRMYWDI